jgi:hypothetical protein
VINLRLTEGTERNSLFKGCSNREEVLTDTLAAHINDAAGKHERAEMQSTMMALVRQRGCASKTFNGMACAAAIGLAGFAITALPASALVTGASSSLLQQLKQDNPIVEVPARGGGAAVRSGGAVRRTTVVGPRDNVASQTVVRRGDVVRPGGAIAAGAAPGFVAAATAVAWAGSPPAPGYCWYYTDPSRTQGFWDVCP